MAPATVVPFPDRRAAGRRLAAELRALLGSQRPVVLALPRGGVAVAKEIAIAFGAPLDVIVTRKIGHPRQPELGLGAVAEGGEPVFDEAALRRLGLTEQDLRPVVEAEQAELARQVRVYRGGKPPPELAGQPVVVADDGLATGVTARAALRAVRAMDPAELILAAPVASPASAQALAADADRVVVLATPHGFSSVGEWYLSFGQLSDADVLALLGR